MAYIKRTIEADTSELEVAVVGKVLYVTITDNLEEDKAVAIELDAVGVAQLSQIFSYAKHELTCATRED